jgi:hypothetical protein
MPLDPTEEQLEALAAELREGDRPSLMSRVHSLKYTRILWPIIRDLVLEEAAKAVEDAAFAGEDYRNIHANAEYYGGAVRAMKGP